MAKAGKDIATWRHETVERQLAAMAAPHYVVGVHHRAEDRMWRLANLTADQVLEHEREFARLNVRGRDIYIAPVHNAGLVLIDDIAHTVLAQLYADNLPPALVVETSPANFQAWLRLAPEAMPRDAGHGRLAPAGGAVRRRPGQRGRGSPRASRGLFK